MIGSKISRLFAIKCIIVAYPFQFLAIIGSISVVTLTFMINIVEGPTFSVSPDSQKNLNDLGSLPNCLWVILVTMTTGKFLFNFSRIWRLLSCYKSREVGLPHYSCNWVYFNFINGHISSKLS